MTSDPHPYHRRSIRLPGYDYAQSGAYFVTICTHEQQMRFGDVLAGQMQLNELGQIAQQQWLEIPGRFPTIQIDPFIVMPNHIHAVILIDVWAGPTPTHWAGASPAPTPPPDGIPPVRAGFTPAHWAGASPAPTPPSGPAPTIGDIVGAYKSLVVHEILKIYTDRTLGKLWQRNYYEHIIRNEADYHRIVDYIRNNPARWELDELNRGEHP